MTVAAPAHPLFHPKDSGPIVRMVGLQNCTDYGYWDGNQWLLTDVAMKIKGNSMLYMRSPGVSDCPGGPKAKRRLSDVEDSPTASRLKRFDSFKKYWSFKNIIFSQLRLASFDFPHRLLGSVNHRPIVGQAEFYHVCYVSMLRQRLSLLVAVPFLPPMIITQTLKSRLCPAFRHCHLH